MPPISSSNISPAATPSDRNHFPGLKQAIGRRRDLDRTQAIRARFGRVAALSDGVDEIGNEGLIRVVARPRRTLSSQTQAKQAPRSPHPMKAMFMVRLSCGPLAKRTL